MSTYTSSLSARPAPSALLDRSDSDGRAAVALTPVVPGAGVAFSSPPQSLLVSTGSRCGDPGTTVESPSRPGADVHVASPRRKEAYRILDCEQVPCAAWNAATTALDTLMLGVAILDSCKDTRPMIDGKLDAELAALLGEKR